MSQPEDTDNDSSDSAVAGASIELAAAARIPTEFGEFATYAVADADSCREHLACVLGDFAPGFLTADKPAGNGQSTNGLAVDELVSGEPMLVRVHSECVTGDVLGSLRCDCGRQLEMSLELIGSAGRGILIYLRDHEGRGIGLQQKLKAYELQDAGFDTVEANLHQGLPADARSYHIAAEILRRFGVSQVRLLTNNPSKIDHLEHLGITVVDRLPLETAPSPENIGYLRTKRDKLGHLLSGL